MAGRECFHCKRWVDEGEAHDCWTTTEAALTKDLSEDLREAWERLRDTAADFGDQRIYASHNSIMFSRTSCYFFVRPKKSFLEVCIFLPRALKAPQVKRAEASSKTKFYNLIQIRHRDEVRFLPRLTMAGLEGGPVGVGDDQRRVADGRRFLRERAVHVELIAAQLASIPGLQRS